MLSVIEAEERILTQIKRLGTERVDLLAGLGRVLAEDTTATRLLPPWDNSAMDGYAVRQAEVRPGVTLPISDLVRAGDPGTRPLKPGTAARIFTGAPVPPGADSVVMQEQTERDGDEVTFNAEVRLTQNVRPAGDDVVPGDALVPAGRALTASDLALLAAQGRSQLTVYRRPVVVIASSGNELVEVDGGLPGPGCIVNSNALALAAAVIELGGVPRMLPIIPDDKEATMIALRDGAHADMLLTSGGVSVGDYDFVGTSMQALSGDGFEFWKVAIKPGKPLTFGHIGPCATFGLPGNPISALVTFEVFVRPSLLKMQGHTRYKRRAYTAVLDAPLPSGKWRTEYQRATVRFEGEVMHVDPSRNQSSGALSSMAGADALVVIDPGAAARVAGETAMVYLLGPDLPATRTV